MTKKPTAYRAPKLTVYGSVRNLTGGSSGSMSDFTGIHTIMAGMMSDPAAKENVVQVGEHPAGFGRSLPVRLQGRVPRRIWRRSPVRRHG